MPINAVVDASVLVSAFLFPNSVPGLILKLAEQGAFTMHLSPILLDETFDALLSPRLKSYGVEEKVASAWCTALQESCAVFSDPLPDIGSVCRDPNDDHVLATALAVKADVIVTGDKDLLTLSQFQAIRIVTARAFLTELAPD